MSLPTSLPFFRLIPCPLAQHRDQKIVGSLTPADILLKFWSWQFYKLSVFTSNKILINTNLQNQCGNALVTLNFNIH